MMNTANGTMMSPSSSSVTAQSPGLKTYFKTPEGRYKLHYEKTHPSGLLHYAHGKTVTQVSLKPLRSYLLLLIVNYWFQGCRDLLSSMLIMCYLIIYLFTSSFFVFLFIHCQGFSCCSLHSFLILTRPRFSLLNSIVAKFFRGMFSL